MRALLRTAVVVAFICAPAIALAQTTATGIRNTKHDLSSSSTGGLVINQAGNNQICIYCHTPHMAVSSSMIWNHEPSTNTSWTWGNDQDGHPMTTTYYGTPLQSTLLSASKRCLACHDGSVAIGDVANAGSGIGGTIVGFTSIGSLTNNNGLLTDSSKLVGLGGVISGTHPVSIPYAGQTGYNGVSSGITAGSSLMNTATVGGFYPATTTGCVSPSGICTAATSDGRLGAQINLIPSTPGTVGTTNNGVECTSCHEPHNRWGNQWFTVVDNTNASGLCRSCHNK